MQIEQDVPVTNSIQNVCYSKQVETAPVSVHCSPLLQPIYPTASWTLCT